MVKRPEILCVGLATVDLVYRVDGIPGPDEKAQALGMEVAAGGPATNAAITAAALGASVTLVTAIGAHPLADLLRADLAHFPVRVIDATPAATAPPPVSAITVDETTGARTIVSRNAGALIAPVPAAGLPEADLTLVDGHHPALATAAARAARRLVVDAGTWRPVFAEIFPHAEVVACSATFRHPDEAQSAGAQPAGARADEARADQAQLDQAQLDQAQAADAATAAAVGSSHVLVTHGPDPVTWFGPGNARAAFPVPPVKAVDTAGAGDAFHGALAVALARNLPIADAVTYAIEIAGVRVTHPGPRSWLDAL